MSTTKKPSKANARSAETQSADKPAQKDNKLIEHLPAIITAVGGLLGVIITGIATLYGIGVLPLSSTPTPSFTPTPTWTATLHPTDTPSPTATLVRTETPPLTLTATETPIPTVTLSAACPWLPYSTLNPSVTIGTKCLNDLLSMGISETDRILFYREKGMNIGVLGISKKTASVNELNVEISIKELTGVRFLVLASQQEQGYQSSVGFRIVREGNNKLIQLVRYDSNGFDSVISETRELDMWSGNFKLSLRFNGPQVRAHVNDAYFGQTQIEFADRHLFLGYQVMTGGANRPYLHVLINAP